MNAAAPALPHQEQVEDAAAKLRRLIAEQGVANTATAEQLLGAGRELFADDKEFEQFLAIVKSTRAERE
jgi:hypothetical protein